MKMQNEQDKRSWKNVWTVAETADGAIHPVSYELLGAARRLADARGGEVWTVALGSGHEGEAGSLFAYGADKVILIDDSRLGAFNDELECNILERMVRKYMPETVLCAATSRGRALMPRLAGKLHAGLTADCTGLAIDPDNGDLLQTRPAFGGNIMATIRSSEYRPQMATVRPRVMAAPEPQQGRTGKIIRETVLPGDTLNVKEILQSVRRQEAAASLGDARIIVSGGRAMKGPEGFRLLERFASLIGGAVGASRAAVDNGWIAYPHQVGQTGATVQTDVYIACGISGQIQHLIGMQSCKTIIAIDIDDTTPMMKLADIAVKGDLFEIIPAVMKELEARKNQETNR
ncbi:MAG: electron transfer flavoprotein subunit alpha/FixB family protein [Abditibacteriota bacterium]|nr:electron transfer flavoprotein subunit alpha/FixB family protein [Abditibacteriota bacterium]